VHIFNVTYLKSKVEIDEIKEVSDTHSVKFRDNAKRSKNILSPPMFKIKWNHKNDIRRKEDKG